MTENTPTHHAVDYIELTVTDMEKTKDFYRQAFDWEFTDYGPAYVGFHDARGRNHPEVGGFWLVDEVDVRPGGPRIHLYSHDIEASRQAVLDAGGTIVRDTFPFPGGARFDFADPNGHELSVWIKKTD